MTTIATLETILTADTSGLRAGLNAASGLLDATVGRMGAGVKRLGGQITGVGGALTTLMAPLAAGVGLAVKGAVDFDSAMANVGAITGQTADEMRGLRAELLTIGGASRAGPQAVAEAFYDIAGGVLDADSRLDVLKVSIATSEAGAASLQGTTSALISVMNAFGTAGLTAAAAGDILTVAVNKGVGTMDELAAAIPGAAAMAANAGLSFAELASAMAFSTTAGFSFSEAGTQMQSIMRAFLNPNADMTKALAKMGYSSGSAALKALGLTGAVRALSKATGGSTDALTQALGRTEAMQGALALAKPGFDAFNQSFVEMTAGATDAARAIQNLSAQASLDHLKAQLQTLGITLGTVLLPRISALVDQVMPVIASISAWIEQNPELTGQILQIVAALAVLGPALIAVGGIITAIGTIIGAVASGPFVLLIAAFAALKLAYDTNFLGFRDTVDRIVAQFPIWAGAAEAWLNTIALYFAVILGNIWEVVGPGLTTVYDWFTQTALPAVVDFVTKTALPAVQTFIDQLASIWETTGGALGALYKWFNEEGMPVIVKVVHAAWLKVLEFIGTLQGLWFLVQPFVQLFVNGMSTLFGGLVKGTLQPVIDKFGEIARLGAGFGFNLNNPLSMFQMLSTLSTLGAAAGVRDSGGPGAAGRAYVINPKAGPELFIPSTSGTFYPNADRLLAGSGGPSVQIGTLVLGDTGRMTPEEVRGYARQGLIDGLREVAARGSSTGRRG